MQRRLPLDGPLDLVRSYGFSMGNLALRHGSDGTWTASRWDSGAATLRLRVEEPELVADAWGPGAEEALEHLPELCGLHADRSEVHRSESHRSESHRSESHRSESHRSDFRPEHPRVRLALRRFPGLRVPRRRRVLEALVPVVIGQRVTAEGAKRSLRELIRRFGEPAPGPSDLWLHPDARTLAGLGYADLHPCGIERARAVVIIRAARQARRLEALVHLPRRQAYDRLTALPGVGPWTAPLVMARAWGDADAVPIGDYHLPSTLAWHLAGERRADDARMVELLRPFRGHRWLVIRLLLQLGDRSPRRGPRTEVADIRGW